MALRLSNAQPLPVEPEWPDRPGPYLFLLEISGPAERDLLHGWLERHRPEHVTEKDFWIAHLPQSRRDPRSKEDPRLDAFLATDTDPLIVPLRVIWFPEERDGRRVVRFSDVFRVGDPRDPGVVRQYVTKTLHPDRVQILMGNPGRSSIVRKDWDDPEGRPRREGQGLADYVAQRAWLALERAERGVRGNRYKVPRFPIESLVERRSFTRGVAMLAKEAGVVYEQMAATVKRYATEIAATHSPYVIDLVVGAVRWLIGRAYVKIRYDRDELQALYELGQRYPLVFLPSHKSNFDHLVLLYVLYTNGLPPNHTAGGDNMNFLPVGPFLRRSGVFFIRREFKDNAPYKFALRQYIDYLLEKRFPIEWFFEGGRSRSGKLRSPRYGLLSYVVESFQRGSADDVVFIPVSIAYDQIPEVSDYTAETSGRRAKRRESLGWATGKILGLRKRYGEIHLGFGAPIGLAAFLNDLDEPVVDPVSMKNPAVPKLAFEVATRINEVTPITPVSMVAFTVLNDLGTSFRRDELVDALVVLRARIADWDLPTTHKADEPIDQLVDAVLSELAGQGLLSAVDGGHDEYAVDEEQIQSLAYYRNTIVHFFVTRAILEVALAASHDVDDAKLDRIIIDEALRLRDLLKFEFFFSPSDQFVEEIRADLRDLDPDWRATIRAEGVDPLLDRMRPFVTGATLQPVLEAFALVADALADRGKKKARPKELSETAMERGRERLESGQLVSPDALSSATFDGAIGLAANRELLERSHDVASRRMAFRDEVDGYDAVATDLRRSTIPTQR